MNYAKGSFVSLLDHPDIVFRVVYRTMNHPYRVTAPSMGAQLTLVYIGAPASALVNLRYRRGEIYYRFESQVAEANEMLVIALASR